MLSLRSRTLRLVHSPRLQLLMPVPVACRQRGVMTPITMQPQRSYNGSNHLSAIAKQTQPQPRPAATDASDRSPAASTSDVGLPQREEEIPQKEEQPGPFEWFSKHLVTVGVSVLSVLIAIQSVQSSGMITSVHKDELVLNSSEAANKHRPHLVRLVEERLKVPYKMEHGRVDDTPGLKFVPRDDQRTEELRRIMSSPGGLTLLEGPSGCGKSICVQHALHDLHRSAVYFSVRDNKSALPRLASFAKAFGVSELPPGLLTSSLDIVSDALSAHKHGHSDQPPPVLVIDDVQQLLDDPAGRDIVQWCLGRAAEQLLTVLFLSSGEAAEKKMRQMSGYDVRLSAPRHSFFSIPPAQLISALQSIPDPSLGFTRVQSERLVQTTGTHMCDVRRIQRMRTEGGLSVEDAIETLVVEQARRLRFVLTANLFSLQQDQSIAVKMRPQIALTVCKIISEQKTDDSGESKVSLGELRQRVEEQLQGTWSGECRVAFRSGLLPLVLSELVEKNVLRRSFVQGGAVNVQCLSFHRPLQAHAFRALDKDPGFKRTCDAVTANVKETRASWC